MSSRTSPPDPPCEPPKRISVEQYHTMIRAGIFDEDDRIELLEGWLVANMPKTPPHSVATGLVSDALDGLLPAGWFAMSHGAITTDDSEPEPDVCIVNLVDRCIEVYSDPTGPAKKPDYRRKQVFGPRESIAVVLDGEEIGRLKVKELLP